MDTFINNKTSLFLFGLTTGIAVAATAQFAYNLIPIYSLSPSTRSKLPHRINTSFASVGSQDDLLNEGGSPTATRTISKLEQDFTVTSQKLHQIVKHFVNEMKRGLAQDGQTLKMIPSYVNKLPTGKEKGTYLALDLGGTNFRVCEVDIDGKGSTRMRQKKFTLSDALKNGTATQMFDFFADCVVQFLEEKKEENDFFESSELLHLGFTFSFPTNQTAIDRGTLIHWTKSFTTSGVEGQDVVILLQEAFRRKNVNIRVAALVNDTVGTLVSHAYSHPETYIGVILGTGSNAAYLESTNQIPKWQGPPGEMIINMEWGAFDDEHSVLPLTAYDRKLDRASPNQKKQTYEKLISGMYLGEIVRYCLVDLIKTGELFHGKSAPALMQPYSFETANMSRIERDHTFDLADTKILLEEVLHIKKTTLDDRRIIKRVCELVGTRSARLSAAGVAAVVTKINKLDGCGVAIDGSLFEHYPHYANRMRDAIRELLGITSEQIFLEQARDGSGQGAAIIAAIASL